METAPEVTKAFLDFLTLSNVKDAGFWLLLLKYLSEFYSAIRARGGLRRGILSFWFGENIPMVVSQDYAKELKADKSIL